MADVMNSETRSRLMSRIRGRDTVPERLLRSALFRRGLRFRIHHKIMGRPDVAFPGARIAVFVHGCFWHGCHLHYSAPQNRSAFWKEKLTATQLRDARVRKELALQGWSVIELWEHEVENELDRCVDDIAALITARSRALS